MCLRSAKKLSGVTRQEEVCAELDAFWALSGVQDRVGLSVVFEIRRVSRQEVADRLESQVDGAGWRHAISVGEPSCGTIAMVWHRARRRVGKLVCVVRGVPWVGRPWGERLCAAHMGAH